MINYVKALLPSFLIGVILMSIGSCATLPTAEVHALASSGETVSQAIKESFTQTESILYERTYLRNTESPKRLNDYLDSTNENLLLEFQMRIRIVEALNAYLEALDALTSRNNSEEAKGASINLAASIRGLEGYVPQSEQSLFNSMSLGIGTSSDFILRYASQGVQRKYLKRAMDKAAPGIDTMCVLLEKDLSQCDALLMANQQSVLSRLIVVRNTETDISKKRDWDMYIGKRARKMKELDRSYRIAIEIIHDLPHVHAEIRKNLGGKQRFREALSTMMSEVKELKQCYDGISSTNDK